MKKVVRRALLLWTLIVLTTCPVHPLGRSDERGVLDVRVRNLDLNGATLLETLGRLATQHGVPIGLEVAPAEKYEPKLNIHLTDAKLSDVLELISRQETDYAWVVRDGVVNFSPTHSRDSFLEKLLNTRVRRFTAGKGLDKFQVRDAVTELPEIRGLLAANDMRALNLYYPVYDRTSSFAGHDFTVTDTDVRGVLNSVIRNRRHNMWVVERLGQKRELLQISF